MFSIADKVNGLFSKTPCKADKLFKKTYKMCVFF